jgi:penicillin amidase
MKKILIPLILVFIILLAGYLYLKIQSSPVYKGVVDIENLNDSTEVLFDEYGIPHIYASGPTDAYRSLGYVHAMERIFQMDMMRRAGGGRLAEMLGADLVMVDKFFRTLGIPQHAKLSAQAWIDNDSAKGKELVYAYLDGINNFIEKGKLPLEYILLGQVPQPFTLEDVFATIGYMSFTFAPQLTTDPLITKMAKDLGPAYLKVLSINTLPEHHTIPVYPPNHAVALPQYNADLVKMLNNLPVPLFMGSNAWVVAPKKSASGKTLFANDTHIAYASPSVWYEAHLEYPGFSFYGNFLAGVPFPLIGHSKTHSYGLTMFLNDDLDLYEEKPAADDSTRYVFADSLRSFSFRNDTIRVKGGDQVVFTIQSSHHGPVMNEVLPHLKYITDNPVTSWWVFLQEPSRALEALFGLHHAQSWQDAQNAARLIHAPGLNVMYGDASGNIAWWATAKIPVRPAHVESKMVLEGWTGKDEILGWYPFEENPMSVNPPEGFVISANNQPDSGRNGVLYPGYYYPGDRYRRIAKALNSADDWTVEKLKKVQTETINETQPKVAHELLSEVDAGRFKEYNDILNELANWQGSHGIEDRAPVVYYKWLYHVLRLMMEDEIGEEAFNTFLDTYLKIRSLHLMIRTEDSPWWDNINTTGKETRKDIVNEALAIALKELHKQFGKTSKWKWGKAVVSVHRHPLAAKKPLDKIFNVETSPAEANAEGINKLAFVLNGEGKYEVKSGPAMRILIDFADVENSVSVLPTGQSGNVFSKHFSDQAELFVTHQYRKQMMNEQEIREKAKSRLVLY